MRRLLPPRVWIVLQERKSMLRYFVEHTVLRRPLPTNHNSGELYQRRLIQRLLETPRDRKTPEQE